MNKAREAVYFIQQVAAVALNLIGSAHVPQMNDGLLDDNKNKYLQYLIQVCQVWRTHRARVGKWT